MDYQIKKRLQTVSTAALTSVLLKRGFRNVWLRGAHSIKPGQPRVVGTAFTLRFVPAREDLISGSSISPLVNTRAAIEDMPEDVIVIADSLGRRDVGLVGDVLCARMAERGVRGFVTDGAIRDREGVIATDLPIWCGGVAAPPPHVSLSFVGWQEPIACGGVAVLPGDIVVADDDGAVVFPVALLEQVVDEAVELENMDLWVIQEIRQGAQLRGLYPMDADTKSRYDARRLAKNQQDPHL